MATMLAVLAVLANGLLAGLSLDRFIVALPAWRRVGVRGWAVFSRHADLGNGLVLYPLQGIGGPLLSIATAVAVWLGPSPSDAILPVATMALLSVAHVVATARGAPNMAKVHRLSEDDEAGLRAAFAAFERWQAVRATLQVLTFATSVWALVALAGGS
jgi:hypothetical protein